VRSRFLALLLLLSLSVPLLAQRDYRLKFEEWHKANPGSKVFDPRDFSGYWTQRERDGFSLGTPPPPLTPAGAAAKAKNTPSTGGSFGNEPWHGCNPMGFPLLLIDNEPMEIIVLPDRIMHLFQWEHRIRFLWTDGREVPSGENLENLGPAWYGHSAGRWEGNKLVINTVGLDERAWLDGQGYPKSFHARIEETWTKIDSNTLELRLTLYDPEFYTAPWVGAPKLYKRIPNELMTYFGWRALFAGITEGICAPMNEVETYNKEFRDVGRAK
jgi:hypothetical protein